MAPSRLNHLLPTEDKTCLLRAAPIFGALLPYHPEAERCGWGPQALLHQPNLLYVKGARSAHCRGPMNSPKGDDPPLRPLTARQSDEFLYERSADLERRLKEILCRDRDTLRGQIAILDRNNSDYVPSECLIYMLREAKLYNHQAWFNQLYRALIARCTANLRWSVNGGIIADAETLREEIVGEFHLRLARGLEPGSTVLDGFEVAFDHAFAALRKSKVTRERKKQRREPNFNPVPTDEPNDPDRWVLSLRADDGSEMVGLYGEEYRTFRKQIMAAIEELPPLERDAILLRLAGWQIHSGEANVESIAAKFGVDEGTIRYRIKQGVRKVIARTQGKKP